MIDLAYIVIMSIALGYVIARIEDCIRELRALSDTSQLRQSQGE